MDGSARIPSRIILSGSSSISLSDRFRQIKQQPRSARNNRMALREPRNFLYDDYMDEERSYGGGRSGHGVSGSRGRRDLDFDLDEYASKRPRRQHSDGLLRRREQILDDFVGSDGQARRFASAMGIQQQRSQPVYEDLEDYGVPMPRGRLHQLNYRDNPPRRPVIRRVVEDRGGYIEQPRTQVIQVVERVRSAPQRRIQVVKRVPIQQRVVKRIVVQKRGPGGNRRSFGGTGGFKGRVQKRVVGRRNNTGGGSPAQKRQQQQRGGPKKQVKSKMSASDLDRELDEYMKGSKHPRIAS